MIKLLTVFALVAATFGAGCKKRERTEDRPGAMKPVEKTPEATALPAECTEYKATIEKIRNCERLPQTTRDALVLAFEQASSGWATTTAEHRASLAASCKSANAAIQQSAVECQ